MTQENATNGGSPVEVQPTVADESEQKVPDDDIPIPGEILEKLPKPMQETIRQTFGIMAHGPMQNPIAKKITPEHISQIISLQDKEIDRGYQFQQSGRYFTAGYVILGVASFFALAWFFGQSDPVLFKQILVTLGTFIGGFAAGWGFTVAKSNRGD